MSEPIVFFVPGVPATKGSWRPITSKTTGKTFLVESCARSKPWAGTIAAAAREAGATPTLDAVLLDLTFFLPRPKGHSGKRGLRPSAPAWPVKKPDLDKLLRSVLDALTGVAYHDDAQVVACPCMKKYADAPAVPGLAVWIGEPSE